MRDVAIVSFAQTPHRRHADDASDVELTQPVIQGALEAAGIAVADIDFVCSGSSDYFAGQAFSFVTTVDAVGVWPPMVESHVEMDAAWALYEAWLKIQTGHADSALVYGYAKSSPGDLPRVLSRQLDPYYAAPLWPDSVAYAGLQARAMIDAGTVSQAEMAEIAYRNRSAAADNPFAQLRGSRSVDELLAEPMLSDPLRRHDCPPISDGAAAVVIAAADVARSWCERPAWIRGIDHRIDSHQIGARDLTTSPSAALAARHAGATGHFDVAELHAPFTHQERLLTNALGLGADTVVNPSGGPLAANPMMAAGLIRLGEAASRISAGSADRAVATATSGHCLQHNLVCVLEGE
jgi:acetyl-CoA acetyltransferase